MWVYWLEVIILAILVSIAWWTWTSFNSAFILIRMLIEFLLLLELLKNPQIILIWIWDRRLTFIYYLSGHHFPLVVRRNVSLRSNALSSWTLSNLIRVFLNVRNRHWFRSGPITVLTPFSLSIFFFFKFLGKRLHFWIVSLLYIL